MGPRGAFTGELERNDKECGWGWSSSSLLDDESGETGSIWEPSLGRFPLWGEGETGSPRRRLRALERAADGVGEDLRLASDRRGVVLLRWGEKGLKDVRGAVACGGREWGRVEVVRGAFESFL